MAVGKRISELPRDNEPPSPDDFVPFTDASGLRTELLTIDQLSRSTAFLGQGVVLTWDGSAYSPAEYIALETPKEFRGPVDPSGISGVLLNTYDVWIDTST